MRKPLVAVVDDDRSVRESLPALLGVLGFEALAFESAHAFLASPVGAEVRCLILDIAMPGMSGPELHALLESRGRAMPVIFITASRDDALCRRLVEAGAVACLYKPFHEADLLSALDAAVGQP